MDSLASWRLIFDEARTGAWNMAIDEAILEAVIAGRVAPTLRFYGWDPPCLSIGYAQKAEEFDLERLREASIGFVRRPSGGRAVLHRCELTYCLCCVGTDWRMSGGVIESYRRVGEGFVDGLRSLGAVAGLGTVAGSSNVRSGACFDAPSRYELLASDRKVIGSAQWRHKGGVLQHGSVPLYGDVAEIADFLRLGEERRERVRKLLRRRAGTVSEVVGRPVSWHEVGEALARELGKKLHIEWQIGELTCDEIARARELASEKYGSDTWNLRA